ncbi:fimbrial protein FimV [Shewanella avicenniae]|uniref:Fimbrial protein FimV n=1 Tax=Shewanella avicenniae TaxID=2814294 RepID=A0ABX7QP49_9GAMM|nr:fimbrial protein FimV [Shewanella avicenniae]QSX33254.1 fimbrial protein FimV [Shewanella avicenniae]
MKSQTKRLSYLIVTVVMLFNSAWAGTSHVSINQRLFDLGKIPLIKLNIVSDVTDTERLQFIVQQQSGEERLMVDRINDFMYLLQGIDEVTDPDAKLVVNEYLQQRWLTVASLPLFADSVPVADPPSSKKLSLYRHIEPSVAVPALEATAAKSAPTPNAAKTASPQKAISAAPESAAVASVNSSVKSSANSSANSSAYMDGCRLDYNGSQTLWRLANRYAKEWNTNVYAAALGILEANPKAFYRGNPSSLRRDAQLRCPSAQLLAQYADKKVAEKKFDALL